MVLTPKALVLPGPMDQGRSRDGFVPSARGEGQSPSWRTSGTSVPCFGCVHDPAAAIPVLCSLPTPPRAHQCWDCRGAVHDFTRDWCSWNCS